MNWFSSNKKQIAELLAPSISSAIVALVGAALAVAFLLLPQLFNNDHVSQYFEFARENQNGLLQRYDEVNVALNSSEVAANLAVFMIWGLAGLVGYALVSSMGRGIRNFIQFEQTVEYFERDRRAIIREALIHTTVRLVAVGLIVCLYFLGMYVILPVAFVATQAAFNAPVLLGTISIFGAFLLTLLSIHVLVLLVRLLLLRTRVFFN
ncbi:MAG TPA: hypothetical protein PK096_00595 [Candidatus Saccharibacteria bacterium]|nr:hypothetical protein [Candidatus Saccharibacteria bacterium]HRK93852.1 hypothetical protein [Candidatus Saccharibacteria bacterium]